MGRDEGILVEEVEVVVLLVNGLECSIEWCHGMLREGDLVDCEEGGGNVLSILQSIESLLHKTREDDKLKSEEEN